MKKTDSTPLRDKVAYLGVFLALALICSYVESLIPFYFGIPGVKLGLTNIVVVLMLYCVGTKEAFAISMLRIVLAGFLFGNLFSILYSLAGGMFSFLVMYLLKRTGKLGVLPVSVAGGMSHNIGQMPWRRLWWRISNIFLLSAGAFRGRHRYGTADRCGSPGDHTKDWRTAETIRRKYVCTHI